MLRPYRGMTRMRNTHSMNMANNAHMELVIDVGDRR